MADSMPTPNVEISQHMQPLYPSFCLESMVSKTPGFARKPWQCKRFEVAQLHDRACAAKFDGGLSGEVYRQKTPAK